MARRFQLFAARTSGGTNRIVKPHRRRLEVFGSEPWSSKSECSEICPAFISNGTGASPYCPGFKHGLAQHILFLGGAAFKGDLSVQMRFRDNGHRAVFHGGIVNSEPDGDSLARRQGPVGGILMPTYLLFFAGEFTEIVRCPADEGFAEQILPRNRGFCPR